MHFLRLLITFHHFLKHLKSPKTITSITDSHLHTPDFVAFCVLRVKFPFRPQKQQKQSAQSAKSADPSPSPHRKSEMGNPHAPSYNPLSSLTGAAMKLYAYVLTTDNGSTPNPFHGTCTLAVCKPAIRRTAQVGDWITATGPTRAATHQKLIYAMRVDEILPTENYFTDKRFAAKKPQMQSPDPTARAGDNMYELKKENWLRHPGPRDIDSMEKDTGGKNALISRYFFYFGDKAIAIPPAFASLIHKNQGHRNKFPEDLITKFVAWLEMNHEPAVHGEPSNPAPERIGK
jgi:hypothetical protein